jgi:hypothetical protein
VCDAFESAFGLTYDNTTELYVINDDIHTRIKAMNPTITFQISNGTRDSVTTQIRLPYSAFDLQASWPIYNRSKNYFPLKRAANESQYTLGRVFLQEAYLIVDFERKNFTLVQAKFPDSHTLPQITAITSVGERRSDEFKWNTGKAIGAAVGGVLCILLVAIWIVHIHRARKRSCAEVVPAPEVASDNPCFSHELESADNSRKELEVIPEELPLGDERQEMEARDLPQELEGVIQRSEMEAQGRTFARSATSSE